VSDSLPTRRKPDAGSAKHWLESDSAETRRWGSSRKGLRRYCKLRRDVTGRFLNFVTAVTNAETPVFGKPQSVVKSPRDSGKNCVDPGKGVCLADRPYRNIKEIPVQPFRLSKETQWHVDADEWCWCPHLDARGAHGEDGDKQDVQRLTHLSKTRLTIHECMISIGLDLPSGPFSLSHRSACKGCRSAHLDASTEDEIGLFATWCMFLGDPTDSRVTSPRCVLIVGYDGVHRLPDRPEVEGPASRPRSCRSGPFKSDGSRRARALALLFAVCGQTPQ
jgi:hypothetical protein